MSGDNDAHLVLRGTAGVVEGETWTVGYGEAVTIGRSRGCDISLRRCSAWREMPAEDRRSEKHFQTVSRRHARVRVVNAREIQLEDLSSNGTFLDDRKVIKETVTDLPETSHVLRLGTQESFTLEWSNGDQESAEGGDSDASSAD